MLPCPHFTPSDRNLLSYGLTSESSSGLAKSYLLYLTPTALILSFEITCLIVHADLQIFVYYTLCSPVLWPLTVQSFLHIKTSSPNSELTYPQNIFNRASKNDYFCYVAQSLECKFNYLQMSTHKLNFFLSSLPICL